MLSGRQLLGPCLQVWCRCASGVSASESGPPHPAPSSARVGSARGSILHRGRSGFKFRVVPSPKHPAHATPSFLALTFAAARGPLSFGPFGRQAGDGPPPGVPPVAVVRIRGSSWPCWPAARHRGSPAGRWSESRRCSVLVPGAGSCSVDCADHQHPGGGSRVVSRASFQVSS